MGFTIKHYIALNGERFSLLYDTEAGGFPMFYPTAFITRAVRDNSTHLTQMAYLEAVKRVCQWERLNNIDLESRFHQRHFLTQQEVDSLTNYLRARMDGKGNISASKFNIHLGYAAKYINWLAQEVITDKSDNKVAEAIVRQDEALKEKRRHRTGSKTAWAQELIAKHLPDEAREQLQDLFENPYQKIYHRTGRATRLRNIVMLRVLYQTGMRRGELLSLKLKSIIESTGRDHASLVIERNHHDETDTRVNQPVAKTLGRIVPITFELEDQLLEYITVRSNVPNVGFDDEDFIFVNHRAGRDQGKPISDSVFNAALDNLKKLFPAIEDLHPHLLRHDWNYRFSQEADDKGLSEQDEMQRRCGLMGWEERSEMAQHYNKRQVQEKAT